MTSPHQQQSRPGCNHQISEFSLQINQTFSASLFSNRRPSTRLIASPSKLAYSRSSKLAQTALTKMREFIAQNRIESAAQEATTFFTSQKTSTISMSPSNIMSPQRHDNQTVLSVYFCQVTCLISLKRYGECLEVLAKIGEAEDSFKKDKVLFLRAVCLERMGQFAKGLEVIEEVLSVCQQKLLGDSVVDCLFLKARLLKHMCKLDEAADVCQQILAKCPNHHQTLKALIDIHILSQNLPTALQTIQSTLHNSQTPPDFHKHLLTKKTELEYKLHLYTQAFTTITQLETHFNIRESKLNYLKGKISLKLSNTQNAIIYFNQALTINSSQFFVRLSLAQLIVYFLRQRDFYQASLYCKRSAHLLADKSELVQSLSLLAEGLILLMKRNFEEGLKTVLTVQLNKFDEIKEKLDVKFLNNLFFNAQAFALFSLGRHQQALHCYTQMQVSQSQQQYLPCFYNIKLVEGIISMLHQSDEQKAIQSFQKAIDYLLRPEPYFYISVILTQKNMKYEGSGQIFMKILSILESGLNVNQTAEMHFYRSLVFMYLGMNVEAIEDLDKAIEVSEDNVIEHFYAKGLIFFIQKNYQQAVAEFQVTLSIDEKYSKAMLDKAKCQILRQNSQQAYIDLEAYRELDSTGSDTTVWQLYFLLQERKFDQIVQIDLNSYYQHSPQQVTDAIEQIKNTCNFFLGRFEESGASGKLVMALIYQTFEDLLKLLDEALEIKVNVGPISQLDLKFIKGYVLFRMGLYEEAMSAFEQIEGILSLNERDMANEELELRFLVTKINIIFCCFAGNNIQACKERIVLLVNEINEGEVSEELRIMLDKIQQNSTNALQNQQPSQPNDEDIYTVELLRDKQLLSSFLPMQKIGHLSFKLIIPFPILEVEQLKPNRQKMLEDYEFKRIQNRPEAPWIKRGEFGVLFTNEIREYNNLHLNTEETQTNSKQKLIDDLKLGSQVLLKLQKIHQSS